MPGGNQSQLNLPAITEISDCLAAGGIPLPGYSPGEPLIISPLGRGESYQAYLIDLPDPLVLRLPYRDQSVMPRPMSAEFAALELVPATIGSHGLAMSDHADNPLGHPYILTTFAPGATKSVDDWTEGDFARLANQLALFHRGFSTRHGLVTQPLTGPISILGEFEEAWSWWLSHHRDITGLPQPSGLFAATSAFLRKREPQFAALRQFCLIHSDLIAPNVIFNGDDMRFIDWEWAEFGDPAKDLALIGGTVHGDHWYVPMTPTQVEDLVSHYAAGAQLPDDPAFSAEALLARRDAWEVMERFTGGLHYLLKTSEDPESHYSDGAATVWGSLAERLRDA
ncbi:MAG: phosphotransferase [Propionibacteriaceae bacterium]|jgi:aminoglycoside phosphotransferase (APT) family kinase protein|nr:phosphotransferase [Propionibacteriaceae bacterium]